MKVSVCGGRAKVGSLLVKSNQECHSCMCTVLYVLVLASLSVTDVSFFAWQSVTASCDVLHIFQYKWHLGSTLGQNRRWSSYDLPSGKTKSWQTGSNWQFGIKMTYEKEKHTTYWQINRSESDKLTGPESDLNGGVEKSQLGLLPTGTVIANINTQDSQFKVLLNINVFHVLKSTVQWGIIVMISCIQCILRFVFKRVSWSLWISPSQVWKRTKMCRWLGARRETVERWSEENAAEGERRC